MVHAGMNFRAMAFSGNPMDVGLGMMPPASTESRSHYPRIRAHACAQQVRNLRLILFRGAELVSNHNQLSILWFHLEIILIFRRFREFHENFREFRENFREFREFGKLINEGKILFCRPGITPLHSQVMQSRFPVRNNCRHDSRMIVSSNSRQFSQKFGNFGIFGISGNPIGAKKLRYLQNGAFRQHTNFICSITLLDVTLYQFSAGSVRDQVLCSKTKQIPTIHIWKASLTVG